MVVRTSGGVISLGGRLVNSRALEIAIYLCAYSRASFHCNGVNSLRAGSALVLHERAFLDGGVQSTKEGGDTTDIGLYLCPDVYSSTVL